MKFLFATLMLASSSLSFANAADPVINAVMLDVKSREMDCDWDNILNTMSALEANYRFVNYLGAFDTQYTIKGNVISATSESLSELIRMNSKIVLNKDQTAVSKVNFTIQYLKKTTVNNGTILNPSYGAKYTVTQSYGASCIVR